MYLCPPFHHTVSSRSKVVARFLCESSPSTARIPVLTTDVLPVPITAVPLDLPVAPASDAFSAYEAFLSSLFLSHPPLPFLLPHHPPAMGACMSSGGIEVSEEDKRLHREAEKSLKEVRPIIFQRSTFTDASSLYPLGQAEDAEASQGALP